MARKKITKKKRKKCKNLSPYQRGLKIGCINTRGLVNSPAKRIDLNNWNTLHDLDVICIQEWYVPKKKDVNDNNNNNQSDDNNNNNNDEMNQLNLLTVTLDMTAFPEYSKVEHDNKTLIMYKSTLDVTRFDHFPKISTVGLDVSWIAVNTSRKIIIIGSLYHNPGDKCEYTEIGNQIRRIKRELKHYNKDIIFSINGDYNAKHEIWGSTITEPRGENVLDWIGENHITYLNNGDWTYKASNGKKDVLDLMTIDMNHQNLVDKWTCHTVYSTRTKVTFNGTTTIPFSDHRGMIADLTLDPKINEKPDRITWNFDESKKKILQDTIKKKMKLWHNEYKKYKDDPNKIDQLVEYFQLLITTTAQNILGFKRYNSNSVNWVDNAIYELLREKKKIKNKISHLLNQMKKHFNTIKMAPTLMKRKLKRFKRKLNKINKKMKKNKYKNMMKSTRKMEQLINDPNVNKDKLFYNAISKISSRSTITIPPIRNPKNDNVIATTDDEIADELHKFYCQPPSRNPYEPQHIAYHQHVDKFVENYPNNRNDNNNIVNRKFTIQETLYVINNLNRNSAMAFDFIHYELIFWIKHQIVFNLTELFNLCYYKHQKCPKIWKYGEFVPIPKPGRVPYYCKNIRPISILPGLGRIIGKLLCNRILTDCINRKILTKNNCAFQRNKSPNDIVNGLVEKVYRAFQNGHFMEIDQLDLKSAYDSVVANQLLYRMINEFNFDGNIIAWYKDFLKGRKTRVKYKKSTTKWRSSLENLPQGQTDSTILFDLMINYINLNDVDKIARDMAKMDEIIRNEYLLQDNKEDDLEIHSDSDEEKADILDDVEIITKGMSQQNQNQNGKKMENNYNYKYNGKLLKIDGMKYMDLHMKIRKELHLKFDWNSVEKNKNRINNDNETINIKKFQIELKNFADDCTLELVPMVEKCQLTKYIKYGYRLNMQHGLNQFYQWTRYERFVLSQPKCSTITFSRKKQQFHAYVYKLDNQNIELIHSCHNGPQKCKHNARLNYAEALFDPVEENGDSDLDNLDENGDKIRNDISNFKAKNPKNPICTIQKTGKNSKKQAKSKYQLPTNIRILGIFLDPELFFKEHIRIVKKKAEIKLHGLLKLAFCKHYQFKPAVILKLFESVIRPKMEYALCTVSVSKSFKELINLQKRAIRIALQAKRNTPSAMLNEIVNAKTIANKLREQQIKLWHKCKRSPENFLQNDTFKNWKQYIETNDINSKDDYGNLYINNATFHHIKNSPLSRCYGLIRSLYKPYQNVLMEKEPSVMRPPPTYMIPFPENIHSINDENEMKNINTNNKNYNFWTDGSCMPNPGPGGAGFYSENFPIKSKIFVIDHDTTINYAELIGVKMVLSSMLRYIEFLKNDKHKVEIENINIYTDSQFVFNLLNEDGYPKIDYYYKLLMVIFTLCNELKKDNIDINIVKVSSHKGIHGNQIADKLAKEAANVARLCKFGESKFIRYNIANNPINVDIAKDLIKLRKKIKYERHNEWQEMRNDRIENQNENRYYGCHNFEKAIIDESNFTRNKNNDMKNELKYLNQKECEVITKLRTEYINLNHYLFSMGVIKHEKGYNCRHCKVPETVDHFLMKCPGVTEKMHQKLHKNNVNYNMHRLILQRKLRKITVFFKNGLNFTVQNILFPHIWQRRIIGGGRNKNWTRDGLYFRVQILKAVVKFVHGTKRFNNDYGI